MIIGTADSRRRMRHTCIPSSPGKHQVKHDQVGAAGTGQGKAGAPVVRHFRAVPHLLEADLQPARDPQLVFDDQNRMPHRAS